MHSPKPQQAKDPKSLEELFGKNSLQFIIAKAERLLQIEEVLKSQLSCEFSSIKVMNVNNHTLTLQVCNAGLATRLRFEEPNLLYALTQCLSHCATIRTLRCQVRPAKNETATRALKTPQKNIRNSDLVQSAAQGVKSAELKAALQRLAKTLEN